MSSAPNYARPCRKGLHEIPAGVTGCPECAQARRAAAPKPAAARPPGGQKGEPVQRLARYVGSLPPDEVLSRGVCSPEISYLFDPVEGQGKHTEADRARLAAARSVCEGCPVRDACYAYAIENRRYGVWGGVYLYPKYYEKLRGDVA